MQNRKHHHSDTPAPQSLATEVWPNNSGSEPWLKWRCHTTWTHGTTKPHMRRRIKALSDHGRQQKQQTSRYWPRLHQTYVTSNAPTMSNWTMHLNYLIPWTLTCGFGHVHRLEQSQRSGLTNAAGEIVWHTNEETPRLTPEKQLLHYETPVRSRSPK